MNEATPEANRLAPGESGQVPAGVLTNFFRKHLSDYNRSTREMLQDLMPGERFAIVPLITELVTGIQQTRKHLKGAYFDETGCDKGIKRIEGYRKRFNRTEGRYTSDPDKSNGCSEGADALRTWTPVSFSRSENREKFRAYGCDGTFPSRIPNG